MSQQPLSRRARMIALAVVLCLNLLCVGLASAIVARFASYPLLSAVLIGQTLFLLMLTLAFLRLIPSGSNLYA